MDRLTEMMSQDTVFLQKDKSYGSRSSAGRYVAIPKEVV